MDISSMLEVQVNEVKEVDSKENVTPRELTPSTTNASSSISQEEFAFYKLVFGSDISVVRLQKLDCTACDAHIGSAPADAHNMFEHPVLHTLLCASCRDFYGDGIFEQGDDATDMFCRWCANGGNLYCCSFCSNTFCSKCIKRNIDPIVRKKIEADERWKCFVCDPRDLYSLRAICWALLQHIQTVNRLLQNDTKLSQQELDEKMNLDESTCCRRQKRKRQRRSNSEEEDTTFSPKQIVPNLITKRKKRGRKAKLHNGNVSVSDRHSGMSEDSSLDQNEMLSSLFPCEQTMLECENATVSADGTIISQPEENPVFHQVNPSANQYIPTMYKRPTMNVGANPNFLPPAPPLVPFRQIAPRTMNPANQAARMQFYKAVQPVPAPMVTIPNQNVQIMNRIRLPLSKPRTPDPVPKPNVIEIESDPEDVAVVGPSRVRRSVRRSVNSKKAVPVALVTLKNSYPGVTNNEAQEKRNTTTLNQRLLPHSKDVNNILTNLKIKFQGLFNTSKREEYRMYELNDARLLIKQYHREIRDTVTQLAFINDRIVREYNKWKRYQTRMETTQTSDENCIYRTNDRYEKIPLDMTCVNESDTDCETNSEVEYSIMRPSEMVGSATVVDGINLFKKGITVDRAVGDSPSILLDKSVQINDVELQDYDKSIRHSTMQQQAKIHINMEYQNYEEQFIQFVQKRCGEKRAAKSEKRSKQLPDPNETSLKDLIEANSPFISEMLETIDKSIASTSSSNSSISVKKNLTSSESQPGNSITCKAVDELVGMVGNINDDLNKKTAANELSDSNVQIKVETPKRHFSISEETSVVDISETDELNSSRCNAIDIESSNEDDCTIIDD